MCWGLFSECQYFPLVDSSVMTKSKIKLIEVFQRNLGIKKAVDLSRTRDIYSHPRDEPVLLGLYVLFPKQNIWVKIPHGA